MAGRLRGEVVAQGDEQVEILHARTAVTSAPARLSHWEGAPLVMGRDKRKIASSYRLAVTISILNILISDSEQLHRRIQTDSIRSLFATSQIQIKI